MQADGLNDTVGALAGCQAGANHHFRGLCNVFQDVHHHCVQPVFTLYQTNKASTYDLGSSRFSPPLTTSARTNAGVINQLGNSERTTLSKMLTFQTWVYVCVYVATNRGFPWEP